MIFFVVARFPFLINFPSQAFGRSTLFCLLMPYISMLVSIGILILAREKKSILLL